ncbi:MAG: MBL fold metallo-hydrolase [Erysipelotrichia bacterium]|nr:MBL fold metallo-hydrolase [Erysipelotrichia bacterium]
MSKYGYEQKSFQSKKTNFVFFVLLIMVIFIWAVFFSPDSAGLVASNVSSELRVDFINVGQGDAILIRTPKGKAFLIDGGTSVPVSEAKRQGRELVQNYLRTQKISRLDGAVLTNWHYDHLGGMTQVLRLFDVDRIWETPSESSKESIDDYEILCNKNRIRRITVKAGDVLEWGNELFVQVLNPDKPSNARAYSDVNNMSIALLIRYGKVQLMLAGDIEEDAEREIMKYGPAISSQILKVPHHGADTSDYMPFLQMVSPAVGVIMVGKNNSFKHPSPRAISHYERIGTKLYRTDRHGNIRLTIGGKNEKDFRFIVDQML